MDYTLPDTANARDLVELEQGGKPPIKPVAFRRLNSDELKLNDDADRIDKASDLELLEHFGWRQPGLADDQAVAVKVSIPAKVMHESEDAATANNTVASGDTPQPAEPPRLEGTLKLILSRYLHIDADLLYREPLKSDEMPGTSAVTTPVTNDATTTPLNTAAPVHQPDLFMLAEHAGANENQALYHVYRMQQSRRMRSGELHYLDHPVFGLVVKVTPYEPPAPAPVQELKPAL